MDVVGQPDVVEVDAQRFDVVVWVLGADDEKFFVSAELVEPFRLWFVFYYFLSRINLRLDFCLYFGLRLKLKLPVTVLGWIYTDLEHKVGKRSRTWVDSNAASQALTDLAAKAQP